MKIENIKFKAKRLDDNSWVFGYFYEENGNTYIIENRQKESGLNRNLTYQVDPSTVYTCNRLGGGDGEENIDPQRQQAMVRHDCGWRKDRGVSGDKTLLD